MNTKSFAGVLVVVSVAVGGCAKPAGDASKSAGVAIDTIQTPTGTFEADNASGAFGGYDTNRNASSGFTNTGGGTGGSSSAQSLHVLSNTVQGSACREGATCACDGGGSYTYERQSTDYGPALQATFDDCILSSGTGFSGDMVLLASDKPLLKSDQLLEDSTADGKSAVLAAQGTFTVQSKTIDASVVLLSERGVDYLAVDVPDGRLVIGRRSSDGLAVVYAKDTTWVCKPDANVSYACEEQNSGKTMEVATTGSTPSGSKS